MRALNMISGMLAFLFILNNSSAQITLEQTYSNSDENSDFGLTWLDGLNLKYYFIDYSQTEIRLYNLDHSIFQNISIPIAYSNNLFNVHYITTSLFDCDETNIEYLVRYHDTSIPFEPNNYIKIFREDGSEIFFADSSVLSSCYMCESIYRNPIVNTPEGTKLFLQKSVSNPPNGDFKVYSLCGELPALMIPISNLESSSSRVDEHPFPNPAAATINLPYDLPININSGVLSVYGANGELIKEFTVDRRFNSLRLSVSEFSAGSYFYLLKTSMGTSNTERFIVFK